MWRSSTGRPASRQTSVAAIPNDASITSEASPPDTDLGSRFPIVELTTKPANGSSGISAISGEVTGLPCFRSPFERRERVGVERFAGAEERDHEREADGGLGRRDRHHEEGDDLPV